jgi:WD40 repeat protein
MYANLLKWIAVFLVLPSWGRIIAAPVPGPQKINLFASQLYRLDPKRISQSERRPWHPAELVAIVGSQRGHHWQSIKDVTYSLDGKHIATLSRDRVYVWEAPSLRFQNVLPIEAQFIRFVPEQNRLLTCGKDGIARLWDLNGDRSKSRVGLRGILGDFSRVACSVDGKKIIVSTRDGFNFQDLRLSPPKSCYFTLGKRKSLLEAAFSPNSRLLVTLGAKVDYSWTGFSREPWISDMEINLWDVSGTIPKLRGVLPLVGSYYKEGRFAFSPDSKIVVWGAHIWDLSDDKSKFRAAMNKENERLEDCIILPGNRQAITVSSVATDYFLHLRDLQTSVPRILQTAQLSSCYRGMALSPDTRNLAIGDYNCLRLWHIKDGIIRESLPPNGHTREVSAMSFGACGNLLATCDQDRSLRLWDLDGSRPHQRLVHEGKRIAWDTVAVSPDGTKLAAGFRFGAGFTLWDVSGSRPRVLHEYERGGTILAFSPDSKTLFSSETLGPVYVIDVLNPKEIAASLTVDRIGKGLRVEAFIISSDGNTLAVGGSYEVELWQRTDSGWQKRTEFRTRGNVKSLSFGKGDSTLMVGGGSYKAPQVDVFDLSGDKPTHRATFDGLRDVAVSVTASPSGHLFAACDETGRVVVWSASGEKKHEWTFPGPVRCVSFAPDGYHLALGNGDGTVYILRLAKPKETR